MFRGVSVGLMLAIGLLGASARGAVQPVVLLNADRLEAPDRYLYGNPRLNSGWVSEGAAFRHQLTTATGMVHYAFALAAPTGCALRVEFLDRARKAVAPFVDVPAGTQVRRTGGFLANGLRYVRIVPSVSVSPKGLFTEPFRLTVDWALDEPFTYVSSDALPPGWRAEKAAVVKRAADNVLSIAPGGFAEPPADPALLTDDYAFAFSVRIDEATAFTVGGLDLRTLTELRSGIWQDVRFERIGGNERLRINGRIVADGVKRSGFWIVNRSRTAPLVLDDFQAFALVRPADYPPAPIAPKGGEKSLVGLNVCSLWRNGFHYGWRCVDAAGGRKPVLGYYDEGLPETADWEIKYLVESGVDFQAFCWYADSNEDELRHPRYATHLEEGFKLARHSDRMKYCLIWEVVNACRPNSLEAWKRNYVPYLIEHHFRDPRYLTVDGKALFAVYGADTLPSPSAFGSVETAKAAFECLDAEVRKAGLKGVLLVASLRSTREPAPVLAEMGFAADFAYNYVRESGIPAENRRLNLLRRSWTGTGAIPTVSVGFDWYPWTGRHNPMMTDAEFADTLRWCRDEFAAGPLARLFWLSTWNEYGEGTFLMPTEVRGFGYLDAVRSVFTDETTPLPRLVPTARQRARLCRLYTEIAAQDPVLPDRAQWVTGARENGDGTVVLDCQTQSGESFVRRVPQAKVAESYVGEVAPPPVRRVKSGERTVFGDVDFAVTLTRAGVRVEAIVRDAERRLPPKGRPWAGDGLDLYIDPTPFADLSQKRAKSVQLYAFPDGTTRAMEEAFGGREVVSAVTETAGGYSVVLTVPWSAFGCAPQRAIGFNLIHNDFAADGSKNGSRVWCDGAPPYVSRFTWALVE